MAKKITESVTLSTVGIEKKYSKGGGGGWPPPEVADSEIPQGSSICDFDYQLPKNPDTLYLKVVGIISSPNRTITKKIDLCDYN